MLRLEQIEAADADGNGLWAVAPTPGPVIVTPGAVIPLAPPPSELVQLVKAVAQLEKDEEQSAAFEKVVGR